MQIRKTEHARQSSQSETDLAKIKSVRYSSGIKKRSRLKKWTVKAWVLKMRNNHYCNTKVSAEKSFWSASEKARVKVQAAKWAKDLLCSSTTALKLLLNPFYGEKCIFQQRREQAQTTEAILLLTLLVLPGLWTDWNSSCLSNIS